MKTIDIWNIVAGVATPIFQTRLSSHPTKEFILTSVRLSFIFLFLGTLYCCIVQWLCKLWVTYLKEGPVTC